MALLTSELRRIRYELGYNVLSVGAEPYIGYHAVFDQVVAVYLSAGAKTTSSTTVAAATSPTLVTLTLASATGITAGDVVYIDEDARGERATVAAVAGSTISVLLTKAHGGTYPVTVEGGEAIVRDLLAKLYDVNEKTAAASATAGIKKADEVEWFGGASNSGGQFEALRKLRGYWQDELASALGVQNLRRVRSGSGGGAVSLY